MRQDNECQVMSSDAGKNEQNQGGINLLVGKSLRKQGNARAGGGCAHRKRQFKSKDV